MRPKRTLQNQKLANQELSNAIEEKLLPMIEQVVNRDYGLAGLGIGIVKNGDVLLARGFGKRNLETGEPVTARSLFSTFDAFLTTGIRVI